MDRVKAFHELVEYSQADAVSEHIAAGWNGFCGEGMAMHLVRIFAVPHRPCDRIVLAATRMAHIQFRWSVASMSGGTTAGWQLVANNLLLLRCKKEIKHVFELCK